jgi:hypothetical protein
MPPRTAMLPVGSPVLDIRGRAAAIRAMVTVAVRHAGPAPSGRATKRARVSDLSPFVCAFAVFFLAQVALEVFHHEIDFDDASLIVFQSTAALNCYHVDHAGGSKAT